MLGTIGLYNFSNDTSESFKVLHAHSTSQPFILSRLNIKCTLVQPEAQLHIFCPWNSWIPWQCHPRQPLLHPSHHFKNVNIFIFYFKRFLFNRSNHTYSSLAYWFKHTCQVLRRTEHWRHQKRALSASCELKSALPQPK